MAKGKLTKKIIAERFEICERTAARYVDAIASSGVPIRSVSGVGGGYILDKDYNPKTNHPAKIEGICNKKIDLSKAEQERVKLSLEKTANEFGDDFNLRILGKL